MNVVARAFLGLLLLGGAASPVLGADPQRVLLIYSFGRDFAPYHTFSDVFRMELVRLAAEPVDIFETTLESARSNDGSGDGPLIDYLRSNFANHRVDLVVPIGDPAAEFAQRVRQELFPTSPLLIAATDERLVHRAALGTNDAAVTVTNIPVLTVETIRQVLPRTTNVVVVIGNSPLEQFWLGELRREFAPFTNRMRFVWLNTVPFTETLKYCSALPPRSVIYFPLLCVDSAGVPHLKERAVFDLHESANAPIFGVRESQLGRGMLGGPLLNFEELGRNTAQVGVRLLRGERPGDFQVSPQRPGMPQFDSRELERWGISEARLPAGSRVLFREPGVWGLYKWPIMGVLLFSLIETALIVNLLVHRAKRRRAEREATLLAEISSKFVNLPASEVDREIEDAQRRVCQCFGLELSALWQWSVDDPNLVALTYLHRPLGGPPIPEPLNVKDYFPWRLGQLLQGRLVAVSSMDKLPPEAARDREVWRQFGVRSNLTFPLSTGGGKVFGALGFNTLSRERSWPEDIVKRLEVVAQIFANAMARKFAEQQLRESEMLNRTTFDQAAVGIAHTATDGRWLRVNDRLCDILGYAREELLQMAFPDITHPEDLQSNLKHAHQVLSGELNSYSTEKRYIRKDGSLVWANLSVSLVRTATGTPRHFIAVVEDITARKSAEGALRESEERLSLAAAAANVGIWMWDIPRDEIWATENWRRMFGLGPRAILRYETFIERVHPKDRPGVERALHRAVNDRTDYVSEHRVLLPDGGVRWVIAHARVHSRAGAAQPSLLGVSVDITERKRAEEAARDLSGRLLSAQEEERARLAKELHDGLSQNLALLSVELEMFGQRLPATAEQIKAHLGEFSRQTKQLSSEVHRISRGLHPAKLTQLGLTVALKGFCREVGTIHGIAVTCEAPDAARALPEDVALCLYRIAQEAIQNVIKHSGARNVSVELAIVDHRVELRVRDDGKGFVVEAQHDAGSLGLVSMEERARLVHGETVVRSTPGEGTCVEAYVPLLSGPVA